MQRSLISPESFFSEEPLFGSDGLLNEGGMEQNAALLEREFQSLRELFDLRLRSLEDGSTVLVPLNDLPSFEALNGPLAHLVSKLELSPPERILLLLALEPYYRPVELKQRIGALAIENKNAFAALGYYQDVYSGGFYPTLQTLLFVCAGEDNAAWRRCEQNVLHNGKLIKEQIITLNDPDERGRIGNPVSFLVNLAPEYVSYLLQGKKPRPDFGRSFPAKWVTTNFSWDQLVLNPLTQAEITDVMDWMEHGREVLKRSNNTINRSFPVLFYGPPGTGKSFTAKLIGKKYDRDVFRVDLSMIVSKYIGETEKNLAQLFDRADGKDWILFFDEADALFGKRTGISDSKDKWANLEMSYLLQRIEDFDGLCILATNLKHNLDSAMTRRFQSLIFFPLPKPHERALIWQKSLPPGFSYAEGISFEKLSRYDMSGAAIANIIKASCVKAVKRGDYILDTKDISRFIRIEYAKDNRTVNSK